MILARKFANRSEIMNIIMNKTSAKEQKFSDKVKLLIVKRYFYILGASRPNMLVVYYISQLNNQRLVGACSDAKINFQKI